MRSLYEKRVNDVLQGFNDLTKTLKIVDIGGVGAQHLPVAQVCLILRFLPNLMSLGSFERTGAAVETLYEEDPSLRFKLVYLHDLYTHKQRMNIIITACPKLQGIYLDCAKGSAVQNIHLLKELKDLKLHKIKWTDVEIALRGLNTRLRTIYLSTIWGTTDIYTLSQCCQNLTRIELHAASLTNSSSEQSLDSLTRIFPELLELHIYRTVLSSNMVRRLFSCSDQLEHIAFGDCNQLSDSDLLSCINSSHLRNLRELWFGQACNLSLASLTSLMENCPAITSIGNLACWGLGPGETSFIKMQLSLTNTDLTLHDYGSDQEEDGFVLVLGLVGDEQQEELGDRAEE